MKPRHKIFVVSWKLYPFDVMVCLGAPPEAIIKWLNKTDQKPSESYKKHLIFSGSGKTLFLPKGGTIIWTRFFPAKGSGVLAHEIYHAVQFLMRKLKIGNEEAHAYAIEYLTNEVNKRL